MRVPLRFPELAVGPAAPAGYRSSLDHAGLFSPETAAEGSAKAWPTFLDRLREHLSGA
ncbi:hypothetical protein TSHO111613_01645 [Tsukamurella hominis]